MLGRRGGCRRGRISRREEVVEGRRDGERWLWRRSGSCGLKGGWGGGWRGAVDELVCGRAEEGPVTYKLEAMQWEVGRTRWDRGW